MEISRINTGAAAYALKKALESPNIILSLIPQTAPTEKQSLDSKSNTAEGKHSLPAITGKGKIIDVMA